MAGRGHYFRCSPSDVRCALLRFDCVNTRRRIGCLSWSIKIAACAYLLVRTTNSELHDGSSESVTDFYYRIRITIHTLLLMDYIRPSNPDDWNQYELNRVRIYIQTQNKQEFFGSANLPTPVTPSLVGFMTIQDRVQAVDGETRKLLHYLNLVLDPQVGQEAVVDNFAAKLLEKLGYDDGDRIIFTRRALPIVVSGVLYTTLANVCVMDANNQILLILQSELVPSLKDPEPQIVAKAIAAFEANNKVRATSLNLPPLDAITFPAISMIGTTLIFYRITISAYLSSSVPLGEMPQVETDLLRYIPELPRHHDPGMRLLENRVEILTCLEAFKQFVGK